VKHRRWRREIERRPAAGFLWTAAVAAGTICSLYSRSESSR
jgi:hypothetical protein